MPQNKMYTDFSIDNILHIKGEITCTQSKCEDDVLDYSCSSSDPLKPLFCRYNYNTRREKNIELTRKQFRNASTNRTIKSEESGLKYTQTRHNSPLPSRPFISCK